VKVFTKRLMMKYNITKWLIGKCG